MPALLTGLSITAVGAAVVAGWQQVRNFSHYILGFALLQRKIGGNHFVAPVSRYIRDRYRRLPSGSARYYALHHFLKGESFRTWIPFKMPDHTGLWRGPEGTFFVNVGQNISLTSIRGISDPDELIRQAVLHNREESLESFSSEYRGYHQVHPVIGSAGEMMGGYGEGNYPPPKPKAGSVGPTAESSDNSEPGIYHWDIPDSRIDDSILYPKHLWDYPPSEVDPFEGLFYPQEVYDLIGKLERWYHQRQWYADNHVPWKVGVLAYGPGGTGKSSLALATAKKLSLPLYQFYLNTLRDREFMGYWDSMTTPCVVALEDFDTVFNGREPTTIHKSLSFECVLNKISGISSLDGVLLMVTTNHLDKIDPALGQFDETGRPTRPGRIDYIIQLGLTTEWQRQNMAQYFVGKWGPELIPDLVRRGESTTAAQFSQQCVELALRHATEQKIV